MSFLTWNHRAITTKRRNHEIIEIANILDPNGIQLEDAVFEKLIQPSAPIPPSATLVHGITNEMLKEATLFPVVARAFVEFMTIMSPLKSGDIFAPGYTCFWPPKSCFTGAIITPPLFERGE